MGCSTVTVNSINFSCRGGVNRNSIFKIHGSKLIMINSNFSHCSSESDGGVIQSFDNSSVLIESCNFQNISSGGLGGAVVAIGGNLSVKISFFVNIFSQKGGGAIWASAYQHCYGLTQSLNTTIFIESSKFQECRSGSSGGAILALGDSNAEYGLMELNLASNEFVLCQAAHNGGALSIDGLSVIANVTSSKFLSCHCGSSGGAISSMQESSMALIGSNFDNNSADGIGGGALFLKHIHLLFFDSLFNGNIAPNGGGGAILWQESVSPAAGLGCKSGMQHLIVPCMKTLQVSNCFWATCVPCDIGTFKSELGISDCTVCGSGTYTGAVGSSACTNCPEGYYATASGAYNSDVCMSCGPGFYSVAGASICSLCPSGFYSYQYASIECSSCSAGKYSSVEGVNASQFCLPCGRGQYSGIAATACSNCSVGTFSDELSSTACKRCRDGQYTSSFGATSTGACTSCESGEYVLSGRSECSLCITGVYSGSVPIHQDMSILSSCAITTLNGSIGRFVPDGNYGNDERIYWLIKQFSMKYITMEFTDFYLERDYDMVGMYACMDEYCTGEKQDARFFTGSLVPGPQQFYANAVLVVFTSDIAGSYSGWRATYSISEVSHQEKGRSHQTSLGIAAYQSYGVSSLGALRRLDSGSDLGLQGGAGSSTMESDRIARFYDMVQGLQEDVHLTSRTRRRDAFTRPSKATLLSKSSRENHRFGQERLLGSPSLTDLKGNNQSLNVPASLSLAHRSATSGQGQLSPAMYGAKTYHPIAKGVALPPNRGYNIGFDPCGEKNIALYGECIASGYERLSVSITTDALYAGVPFNLSVRKLDAYGNTILSDSNSVLQVIATSNSDGHGSNLLDSSVSIVGPYLAQLSRGVANFLFAVEPTFSLIDLQSGTANLSASSYLFLKGADSQAAALMISELVPLNLQQGINVCPAGYIPVLGQHDASKGPAVCQLCKAGTYSLSPLAHMSGSSPAPNCINCPVAGICTEGGTDAQFEVGTWAVVGGIYVLTSCPEGFELINSTAGTSKGEFSNDAQQCRACLSQQYILDPNRDTCQTCPPGLTCTGTSAVVPVIMNSTWVRNRSIYRLTGCPVGYSILSVGVLGTFDAVIQQCSPCPRGEECISPPCTTCSLCQPGYYKASAGIDNCVPCPVDTYATESGSRALSACQRCPTYGSTQGRVGQTSQADCTCGTGYYPAYASGSESFTCVICPAGAKCPDGSCALSKFSSVMCPGGSRIIGDWMLQRTGLFVLQGCPAGYYLYSDQCQLCPALYYCSGGSLPSTPCSSGQFSTPGSAFKDNCSSAVFVYVVVNLPILRLFFTDQTSSNFQHTLAYVAGTDFNHVVIDIVQFGNDPRTTDVTSKVATLDPTSAEDMVLRLNATAVQSSFDTNGFKGSSLMSVQVTACVPGNELLVQPPPSTCVPCQSNYFCSGGSAPRAPCPGGGFSVPAVNSSDFCTQTAVVLVLTLPIPMMNFTAEVQIMFKHALALTAGVKANEVAIISISNVSSARRAIQEAVELTSQITVANPATAAVISAKVDQSSLNLNLQGQGLPKCSFISVVVQSSAPDNSSGSRALQSALIGACIGGFMFFLCIGIAGFYLLKTIAKQRTDQLVLDTFKKAKAGDAASVNHLPRHLQKQFIAETVLGKGAYGCVVKARKKGSDEFVAVKIIFPERGRFDEKQTRQLKREANVLSLFTSLKCEHAVMLAGLWAVEIRNNVCWFIMDLLDGDSMDCVIHQSTEQRQGVTSGSHFGEYAIDDIECIKVARCVLAALKVMHAEGVVHRDLKPANIVRCKVLETSGSWDGRSYTYKLIDFGSSLGVDETVAKEAMMTLAGNRGAAAGTLQYMSPEMFKEPEKALYPTDIWSLGVTMFELVTGRLPFQADSDLLWSFAIAGNFDEKAPNVLDSLSEDRRPTFDNNLATVIATSLEKRVNDRYKSSDEMHEAIYCCLIARGEGFYSAFISYRVASEAPLARILFDELNHSVTPGGHRVTVFWDARRLIGGENWEDGFGTGLLNSLCFLPLLSYGSTAPLAALPKDAGSAVAHGWESKPVGRKRLEGNEFDPEDNFLKELLIAVALLDLKSSTDMMYGPEDSMELGQLEVMYPILIGRQQPEGHPEYPRMGNYFHLQGGGGTFPCSPSQPTARAASSFFRQNVNLSADIASEIETLSVEAVVQAVMQVQGCQLWNHPQVRSI
jgi:serine/threonine protein kinase